MQAEVAAGLEGMLVPSVKERLIVNVNTRSYSLKMLMALRIVVPGIPSPQRFTRRNVMWTKSLLSWYNYFAFVALVIPFNSFNEAAVPQTLRVAAICFYGLEAVKAPLPA